MAIGQHLRVKRPDLLFLKGFWHHGIDLGDGTVAHVTGENAATACVHRTNIRAFAANDKIEAVDYDKIKKLPSFKTFTGKIIEPSKLKIFSENERVEHALNCIGKGYGNYDPELQNCEHFATSVVTDQPFSLQSNEFRKFIDKSTIHASIRLWSEIIKWHAGGKSGNYSNLKIKYMGSLYSCKNSRFLEMYDKAYHVPVTWAKIKNETAKPQVISETEIAYPLTELAVYVSDETGEIVRYDLENVGA